MVWLPARRPQRRAATPHSKLGRRIVVQFMLAVSLPLAVLGTLTHGAISRQAEAHGQHELDAEVSAEAMRVLDRLLAARAALQHIAQAAPQPGASDGVGGLFLAVTRLADDAGAASASPSPAQQALQRWWREVQPPAGQSVAWKPAAAGEPAAVVLSLSDADGRARWLAHVDPAYLWADTFSAFEAQRACVTDADGRTLHCADTVDEQAPPADARTKTLTASKALFLRKEFGAADWTFRADRQPDSPLDMSLGGMVVKAVVAALLLVLALSLVQVRRTMGPLQQLVAVTRRLSQQDYGARVAALGDDEFRELGESFNDMAAQTEAHVGELRMLAAIDRDILDAPDVDRLFARLAEHLGALVPSATVALCEVLHGAAPALRCHRRAAGREVQAVTHAPAAEVWDALSRHDGAPGWIEPHTPAATWLADTLQTPAGAIYRAAAVSQGRTQALLLIAVAGDPVAEPPWRRHVDELRHRVAVAVAAAAHARQLMHQATHDSLTGLHNRAGLHAALDDALRAGQPFAAMFADLDRFKGVNDSLGHQAGDELLCLAAQRLLAVVPGDSLLARPGGDEFVVLVRGAQAAAEAARVAATICRTLAEPFTVAGQEVVLGASVGWALYPDDGGSAVELMRHADMAMYNAKDGGRGRAVRFEPQMDRAVAQHAWVVSDLRRAVERGQLLLHYQPRVDANTGIADTAEALVRWQHPTRGLVPPAVFVEVAEEIGVIHEMGRWVLREACRQIAQWRREGVPIECVSVNLSALQLADETLFDQVVAALEDHGLAPGNIELEVTESVLVGDQTVAAGVLARLRERGIAIALDDFGTGYSSMAYLSNMPVDVIKVDRAFVKNLGQDRLADTVTRAIVTLAHSLELRLVAEGVETSEQAQLLRAMGCEQLQGYLYSRPVPAAQYPGLGCVLQAQPQPLLSACPAPAVA